MGEQEFDPRKYTIRMAGKGGAEYLTARGRLLWALEQNPQLSVSTDLVAYTDEQAVFKCVLTTPEGRTVTGWGSETPGDFGDYLEKAETKALGRALAHMGFGTEAMDDAEPISDAPRQAPRQQSPKPDSKGTVRKTPATPPVDADTPATNEQILAIERLSIRKGFDDLDALEEEFKQYTGKPWEGLTAKDAGDFIGYLNRMADQPTTAVGSGQVD